VFAHKAFRAMFLELYLKLGNVDHTDDDDVLALKKLVDQVVANYTQHNHEESSFWADSIKAKEPVTVGKWLDDHKDHEHHLQGFKARMEQVLAEKDEAKREKLLAEFYSAFGEFLSADLTHMHWEENGIMQIFWDNYTDAELNAIELEFVKTMDKTFLQALLPYMLRGHNISGRIDVLKILQQSGAPEEAVRGLLGLISTLAKPSEVTKIKAAIGVA